MAAETAVWRHQLTSSESAQLVRGAGVIAQPRPDVLVVGGGIVGVATAAACYQAGAGSVQLIEAGMLGSGATGGAAGLLVPEVHVWSDPESFVALARSSLDLWRELEQTVPGTVGLIELDWIGPPPSPDGSGPRQQPAAERLDAGQMASLVPGLASPVAGFLIRRQARVNPLRALARLATVVPAIATSTAATSVTVAGDRLVCVSTTAGEIYPGSVVFATGLPPSVPGLTTGVPASRAKGHLLVTEPSPVRLPGTVVPVATQLEDGRLLAGGTMDIGDDSPDVRQDVIDSILADLCAKLPQVIGLRPAYQWCCFRPRHPDGYPVIDQVPGLANAWLTSGHFRTGILMAPITAQMITRWISAGKPPPDAAPWSSARFAQHGSGTMAVRREGGALSRASSSACCALAMANWLKRSVPRSTSPSTHSFGSKPGTVIHQRPTSPARWRHGAGRIAISLLSSPDTVRGTPTPKGDTHPRPVITTPRTVYPSGRSDTSGYA
jgi:glycine oxidase